MGGRSLGGQSLTVSGRTLTVDGFTLTVKRAPPACRVALLVDRSSCNPGRAQTTGVKLLVRRV